MPTEVSTSKPLLHEAAMLQWINDFAPYGVVTTDTNFRIQSWNLWMATHSGLALAEVADRSLFEIFPDLKERGLGKRFDRALTGEVSVLSTALHGYLIPMEPPLSNSGFEQMQQTARIAPLVFGDKTVGAIIVIEDVTQRESQALLLRRQHEGDALLSWALAHLLEAQEPRRSVRDLFCRVAEQSDFDGYLLYLRDEVSNLKLQAYGGILPELGERVSVLGPDDPLSKALTTPRTALACENLDAPGAAMQILYDQFGFKVCGLLPLDTPEGSMGVLCLGARNRSVLNEGELDLLSTIGKYLAVSLHKEATNAELLRAQSKLNQHALELERQVNDRTATLRDIISELETFSYTLAHDLRAPIRALIGYSEAVLEDYSHLLPADGIDLLSRLRGSCKQLDRLTRDLLEFSKVSRQDIQLEMVDLEEVVSAVITLLPNAAETVQVRTPLHPVRAHRGLLQQCISNLVDNALKFVKEGEMPQVTVCTQWSGSENLEDDQPPQPFSPARQKQTNIAAGHSKRLRIVVQDNGIGVTPGAQAKIFGIFERGTSSVRFSGSGIGLAIVARAVQKMGGTCGVDSELGVGSRFWLELPAA
ncbi:MAG: sensor histidine kinase [Limisphaerales bacterium]